MIIATQLRAARALLRWDQRELAQASGLSLQTIKRMEASDGLVRGTYESVSRVQEVLERAGIEFLDDDAPGVRLRVRPTDGR